MVHFGSNVFPTAVMVKGREIGNHKRKQIFLLGLSMCFALFFPGVSFAERLRPQPKAKFQVFNLSFQRVTSSEGIFRGRVKGSGPTALYLHLIRNGKIVGERLIGRITLDDEPKGVHFAYRFRDSNLTKGATRTATNWKVVAVRSNIL